MKKHHRPTAHETRPRYTSPSALPRGVLCTGCRWPERCGRDRICWAREKRAVQAEKGYPQQTLEGFPEYDGVGPVPYGVIPF